MGRRWKLLGADRVFPVASEKCNECAQDFETEKNEASVRILIFIEPESAWGDVRFEVCDDRTEQITML